MSELGPLHYGALYGLSQLPEFPQIDMNKWQVEVPTNIWSGAQSAAGPGGGSGGGQGDVNVMSVMPPPPPYPAPDDYLIPVSPTNVLGYLPFAAFIISEVILGLVGFYLSAADKNSNWYSRKWNWTNDATYAAAVGGGVEGVLMPYAFYYSADAIGFEGTLFKAVAGAYLGGAAANRRWDPSGWSWNNPKTINGIFEGIQNTVWLVDAIQSIYSFIDSAGFGPKEEGVFETTVYFTGFIISYYYIAEDFNGNYKFWEWNPWSPNVIYGLIRGFESGTRLPVGFGEIGLKFLDSIEKSIDKPDFWGAFVQNFAVRNKWKIAGALWLAIVYTSEESESLNLLKWDLSRFETLEAFLNGIVFGKDLDEMFVDVRKYLLGSYRKNEREKHRGLIKLQMS